HSWLKNYVLSAEFRINVHPAECVRNRGSASKLVQEKDHPAVAPGERKRGINLACSLPLPSPDDWDDWPPSISVQKLHQLVVGAEEQERRRPLPDEERVLVAPHALQCQRPYNGSASGPQKEVRRNLCRLPLDCCRHSPF